VGDIRSTNRDSGQSDADHLRRVADKATSIYRSVDWRVTWEAVPGSDRSGSFPNHSISGPRPAMLNISYSDGRRTHMMARRETLWKYENGDRRVDGTSAPGHPSNNDNYYVRRSGLSDW